MLEFLYGFSKGKKAKGIHANEVASKAIAPADKNPKKYVADDFYTTLINLNRLNSSRDLLLYFFNNVSEINSIITYIAQKGSDVPYRHVRNLGNGKIRDLGFTDTMKLLKSPNYLNRGRTFMVNAISSFLVYGFIPINKIIPIGWDTPTEIYLLSGNNFYPIPEKAINMYGTPAYGSDPRLNRIVKYRHFIDTKQYDFSPDEIILINDSNLSFENGAYMMGQSRLHSAIRAIKTLDNIYDTINTLIADKGAAGFLTRRSKATEVDPGFLDDSDDKKEVENKLYSYGTTEGKRPIGVSSADLGFVRLSVPINEFMPIELKSDEFRTLATALLFPSVLLNDKEGSIYNNVSLAQKAFYTDCLKPIVNLYNEALSEGLGLTARNESLIADWDTIDCLQADKKLEAETNKVWNEVFEKLWNNNLVTRNQWLAYLGLPEISDPEYNKRKNELAPEERVEEINTEQNATT